MSVRITPADAIVCRYSEKANKWIYTKGIIAKDLPQYVEIQPGVTIGNIISIVERSTEVRALLSELCYVDFDEIKKTERGLDGPIMVPICSEPAENVDDQLRSDRSTGAVPADHIRLENHCSVREEDGGRHLVHGLTMVFRSNEAEGAASLGNATYADLKGFEIILDPVPIIARNKSLEKPASIAVRFTLWEVLEEVVGNFGSLRRFKNRPQRSLQETRELYQRFQAKKMNADKNEDGEDLYGDEVDDEHDNDE